MNDSWVNFDQGWALWAGSIGLGLVLVAIIAGLAYGSGQPETPRPLYVGRHRKGR